MRLDPRILLPLASAAFIAIAIPSSPAFADLCAPGSFSATGEDPCTPCAEGTFANTAGQTSCTPCSPGTFADSLGQASCTSCGLGTFASSSGQSECTQCSPGTFADSLGQASCTACDPGTFASTSGQSSCTACDAGTFAATLGASACTACTPACAAGTYQAMACTATSDTGCAVCDASCAACSGGSATDCTSCSTGEPPAAGECAPGCSATPVAGCRLPVASGKAKLTIRDNALGQKDFLKWNWVKGSATAVPDFGNPTTTDEYFLCIYDAGARISSTTLPMGGLCAGKPCWKSRKSGFVYMDKELTPDGALAATLKAGTAGKATVVVSAKGVNLETPNPTLLTGPILVQLQRADGGICFEAAYGAPFKKNKNGSFFDLAD